MASNMFCQVTESTAFATIRLAVSHMPKGQISGFLSKATRWQTRKATRPARSTNIGNNFLATSVKAWQRSSDALSKEEHDLLQQWASVPEWPPILVVDRAAEQMHWASSSSKINGCTVGGSDVGARIALVEHS